MRAIRALSAATLGLSALALTACTSAAASDDVGNPTFGYNLQPDTIAPGGRLSLPVQGCKEEATVTSGVFQTVTIPKGGTSATAVIDRNARPGTSYDVTFRCGHQYGHRKLTIGAARKELAGSKESGNGGAPESGGGGYGNGNGGGGYGNVGGGYGNGGGGYGNGGGGYGNGGGVGGGGYGIGGGGVGGYGNGGGGGYGGKGGGGGYEQHGVQAGIGGSIRGFHLKEVGLGAALIIGSVGTAWHMARRRTTPRA
ncbi:hypothetical protein [Streptomyces chiangmaiensis]|uniref:Lipoprotein n=1 Tax=Streptomyces chiangmaiensis TaxID=766497 RepID=A0ABU7FSQ6_9ACTN|nr:hypothetical protein [Streptomyces chiangmaiensis]MED7826868.1 hypothetical protein [Streptomyces chiangmaiensis]